MQNSIADRIMQQIEKNRDEYIAFLSEYIRHDSTNPALGENADPYACQEWLRDRLTGLGIFDNVDFWKSGDGFSNVVASVSGTGEPLMFLGHTDTVPVTETQLRSWRPDAGPWSGAVLDGSIHGRGASDMKSGSAAPLMAMVLLHSLGIKPRRPLLFSYVMSEETGGRQYGVDSIMDRGYIAKECIVMEPTNDLHIVPAVQGEFYFRIRVKGKSYHLASRHHAIYPGGYGVEEAPGKNAIELAIEIIEELQKLEKELGLYIAHPLTEHGATTINISGIESQGIFSAGAEECTFIGSMLYVPSLTQEEAMGYFREAIRRVTERNLWLKANPPVVELPYLLAAKPPINVDLSHPICAQLAEAAQAFGKEPVFEAATGTSDANYIQDRGCETITMGPGKNEYGVHGLNEYVPVDVYLDAIARFAYFLSLQ